MHRLGNNRWERLQNHVSPGGEGAKNPVRRSEPETLPSPRHSRTRHNTVEEQLPSSRHSHKRRVPSRNSSRPRVTVINIMYRRGTPRHIRRKYDMPPYAAPRNRSCGTAGRTRRSAGKNSFISYKSCAFHFSRSFRPRRQRDSPAAGKDASVSVRRNFHGFALRKNLRAQPYLQVLYHASAASKA